MKFDELPKKHQLLACIWRNELLNDKYFSFTEHSDIVISLGIAKDKKALSSMLYALQRDGLIFYDATEHSYGTEECGQDLVVDLIYEDHLADYEIPDINAACSQSANGKSRKPFSSSNDAMTSAFESMAKSFDALAKSFNAAGNASKKSIDSDELVLAFIDILNKLANICESSRAADDALMKIYAALNGLVKPEFLGTVAKAINANDKIRSLASDVADRAADLKDMIA